MSHNVLVLARQVVVRYLPHKRQWQALTKRPDGTLVWVRTSRRTIKRVRPLGASALREYRHAQLHGEVQS